MIIELQGSSTQKKISLSNNKTKTMPGRIHKVVRYVVKKNGRMTTHRTKTAARKKAHGTTHRRHHRHHV